MRECYVQSIYEMAANPKVYMDPTDPFGDRELERVIVVRWRRDVF